jgi:acyl-[acyl carrier protein]--UDP-N-acetylglucosamine O-acyltransferase
VVIGEGVKIHHGVKISGRTYIHPHCEIFSNSVIGFIPQDKKFSGETESELTIGSHTIIRENCVIHPGTKVSLHIIVAYLIKTSVRRRTHKNWRK